MKYSEVIKQCIANVVCDNVPYVEGHAGIGKSQIPKAVAKAILEDESLGIKDAKVFSIFGSIQKEGELGGIPIPYENEDGLMMNRYTIFKVFKDIIEYCKGEDTFAILFIDEINRCDPAVQQELMKVILEKEINEAVLPENCSMIAAGNPDGFDYQVLDMNDALLDRMSILTLDSDAKEWLEWAANNGIDEDVIEFIADRPEFLHQPQSEERVKPTPRSYEKFSKSYDEIKRMFSNEDDYENIILDCGKSIIGPSSALAFINFIRNKENPMIKVDEFFSCNDKEFKEVIIPRFNKFDILPKGVMVDRIIKYIDSDIDSIKKDKKRGKLIQERFIEILKNCPKDSTIGELKNIGKNYNSVHDFMTNSEEYMDLFFDCNSRLVR